METIKNEATKVIVWDFLEGNLPLVVAGISVTIGGLIGVIGGLIPVIASTEIASKAAAAAQWLWNAAITANPIGVAIAGIGLFVAAIIALKDPIMNAISWIGSLFSKPENKLNEAVELTNAAISNYNDILTPAKEATDNLKTSIDNLEESNRRLKTIYEELAGVVDTYGNI